jgi:hypothetical protein
VTEALRALGVLAEAPSLEHAAIAEALDLPPPPSPDEHMAVLGFQLPPYASIYLGAEGMLGGEARDRIAGLWRALGGQSPREPDHLSVLCAALAELADADRPANSLGAGAAAHITRMALVEPLSARRPRPAPSHVGDARAARVASADPATALVEPASLRRPRPAQHLRMPSLVTSGSDARAASADVLEIGRTATDLRIRTVRAALYWEHIASWMPPYLAALRRIGSPFYIAWADTLEAVLAAEADAVGPPSALPLALRSIPAPDGPPADLDALLSTVMAPVRIGMVITRDDLVRCAAALGLGLRAGERRFALRTLLGQDAGEVLGWLAAEASRQAEAYGDGAEVSRWWQVRAQAGARWLDQRSRDARSAEHGA